MLDKNNKAARKFKALHKSVMDKFLQFETSLKPIHDKWEKPELGEGYSVVIDGGEFFDKAGINFSQISGKSLPRSSVGSENFQEAPYFATGVSVVFHPKNPNIPTSHLNVRYFCTFKDGGVLEEWFGGGFDLTPYILFEEDCSLWHKNAKKASSQNYEEWKTNCDAYFYLKHRNEHRGIGGVFYEKQEFEDIDEGLNLSENIVNAFINSYLEIISKRKDLKFSERQKEFQRFRRGRYVEFNLLYDRGTLFGLQSGGRIESILMSLPNEVSWRYKFDEQLTDEEKKLYVAIKKSKKWA